MMTSKQLAVFVDLYLQACTYLMNDILVAAPGRKPSLELAESADKQIIMEAFNVLSLFIP